MKESELPGKLLPGHPDIFPIIENIREKYQLPEVDPDGEPIKEIYLGDDFRQKILARKIRRLFVYGVGEN